MKRIASARARLAAAVADLPVETIALIIVLGLVLGVFPACGIPSVLCILAAVTLRLNVVALQLVNHLSSPLQLTLLVPFNRAGALIFGASRSSSHNNFMPTLADPHHAVSAIGIAAINSYTSLTVSLCDHCFRYRQSRLHAIAGWFCICLPTGIILYFILARTFQSRDWFNSAS